MQEEEANIEVEVELTPIATNDATLELQLDINPSPDSEHVRDDSHSEEFGEQVDEILECPPEGGADIEDELLDDVDICLTGEIDIETTPSVDEEINNQVFPEVQFQVEGETADTCFDDTIAKLELKTDLNQAIYPIPVEVGGTKPPEEQPSPCCAVFVMVLGWLLLIGAISVLLVGIFDKKDKLVGENNLGEILFWVGIGLLGPAVFCVIIGTVCYCKIRKALRSSLVSGEMGIEESIVESSTRPTLDLKIPVKGQEIGA